MSGPSAAPLVASEPARLALERLVVSPRASQAVVLRARIVLLAMRGLSNAEIARRSGASAPTVLRWRRRFAEDPRSSSLEDIRRSGRPPRIAIALRVELIQIACARPTPELSVPRATVRLEMAKLAEKEQEERQASAIKAHQAAVATANKAHAGAARARVCVQERRDAARLKQMEAARTAHHCMLADEGLRKARRAREDAEETYASARRVSHPVRFSGLWTLRTLQGELQHRTGKWMSLSEVGRTLRCGGLRPHRERVWLHSPDPEFRSKAAVICELYVHPPPGARVLCVDEKPGMLAREALYPSRCDRRSRETRRDFEYVRHGTSTLLAAFDVGTGKVFGRCWSRTAAGLLRFLEELAVAYPTGDVYVVWDNLNTHRGPAIDAFAARHGGRFHFVYTPLHASWVNQVEIWFGILQRRVLRHGSFRSTAEVDAAVLHFIEHWNALEAHPFRWRFRGDFEARRLALAA